MLLMADCFISKVARLNKYNPSYNIDSYDSSIAFYLVRLQCNDHQPIAVPSWT